MTEESKSFVCKNCENEFEGNFCNNCGQSSNDYDKPFNVLIIDALSNIWAFDTRLWLTLKTILFKPGEMVVNYIEGKRVRYMPPFRLYLFISFIFFMLLKLSSNSDAQNSFISVKDTAEGTVNSQQIVSNFLGYMTWALILMMPVYAFALWSLFRKQQRHFLAHFIFALNQHAFLFVILSILILISFIFPEKSSSYEAWLLILFPVYLLAGGRKLYKQKWRSVIIKMFAAFLMYMIIVIATIVIVGLFTANQFDVK